MSKVTLRVIAGSYYDFYRTGYGLIGSKPVKFNYKKGFYPKKICWTCEDHILEDDFDFDNCPDPDHAEAQEYEPGVYEICSIGWMIFIKEFLNRVKYLLSIGVGLIAIVRVFNESRSKYVGTLSLADPSGTRYLIVD